MGRKILTLVLAAVMASTATMGLAGCEYPFAESDAAVRSVASEFAAMLNAKAGDWLKELKAEDGTVTSSFPEEGTTGDAAEQATPSPAEPADSGKGASVTDDYAIPEEVTGVAPVIGALVQLTAMVSVGENKIAAAPSGLINEHLSVLINQGSANNPARYDSTSAHDIIQSGAQVAYGPSGFFPESELEKLKEANVTYLPMDNLNSMEGICATAELIGAILGEEEQARAREVTAYWKGEVADAQNRTAQLKKAQRPTVLNLALGESGYTCEPGETMIGAYIEAAGGRNVVKDYKGVAERNTPITSKQIEKWNPSCILAYSYDVANELLRDPLLKDTTAVRTGSIYVVPKSMYLWSVRSGEGALMPAWIGTCINPELFTDVDMNKKVRAFFKRFYEMDISTREAELILGASW